MTKARKPFNKDEAREKITAFIQAQKRGLSQPESILNYVADHLDNMDIDVLIRGNEKNAHRPAKMKRTQLDVRSIQCWILHQHFDLSAPEIEQRLTLANKTRLEPKDIGRCIQRAIALRDGTVPVWPASEGTGAMGSDTYKSLHIVALEDLFTSWELNDEEKKQIAQALVEVRGIQERDSVWTGPTDGPSVWVEQEPIWLSVIRYWCALPDKTGPTLPFIFGANRRWLGLAVPSNEEAEQSFQTLLDEIKAHAVSGRYFCVRMCSVIKQPVITIEHQPTDMSDIWAKHYDEKDSLHIQLGNLGAANSETELWRLCRDPILQGHYSFRDGEFREFDSSDEQIIEAATGRSTSAAWAPPNPTRNPFTDEFWNLTHQGFIFRENPARAEQLAREAGTTIGGPKPK